MHAKETDFRSQNMLSPQARSGEVPQLSSDLRTGTFQVSRATIEVIGRIEAMCIFGQSLIWGHYLCCWYETQLVTWSLNGCNWCQKLDRIGWHCQFQVSDGIPGIFSACHSSPTSKSSTLQALLKYPSTRAKSIFYEASRIFLHFIDNCATG